MCIVLEINNYKNLVFDSNLKPYERYIDKLKAWCLVTDLLQQKQGVAIALSLPESDASGIRDKEFNEITLTNLSVENGADKLIEYMDKLFEKDELSEVYERFIQFERYKKTEDVKMEDFILKFKKLYNRIRQRNTILPPVVIALKSLDASQLDSNNQKLVLTALDYNKVNMLFNQMKNAL